MAHCGTLEACGAFEVRPSARRGSRVRGSRRSLFRPGRLFAATPLRCRQTLEPLAARLDLPIVTDSAFAEPGDTEEVATRVKVATARLAELRDGATAAVCSQGKVMPPLLALLRHEEDPAPYKTAKGGGWLLSWSGGTLAGLSRL